MVIAKTASRNAAFKADMKSQAVLEAQASFVTPEATDQEASSERHLRGIISCAVDGCLVLATGAGGNISVCNELSSNTSARLGPLTYTFLITKSLSVNFSLD